MLTMFNTKRALNVYGISVLSVSLICVVLRLIGTLLFFDIDIGYYQTGKIVPIIANVLPCVSVVISVAFCMIPRIKVCPVSPKETRYTKLCAVISAIAFAIFTVTYGSDLIEYSSFYGKIPFSYLLCLICAIAACAFFALKAFRQENTDIPYIILGLFTVVWSVLQLAQCYFDNFVQMNSPTKLIFQFACLSAMLLTVNEMRIGVDSKRKSFHLFSATVATIFLPLSSIPSIICYLTGNMPSNYVLFFPDCVMLLISVFAIARLVQMCFGKESADTICDELAPVSDGEDQTTEEESTDIIEEQN